MSWGLPMRPASIYLEAILLAVSLFPLLYVFFSCIFMSIRLEGFDHGGRPTKRERSYGLIKHYEVR
jgi:hypothetical protein